MGKGKDGDLEGYAVNVEEIWWEEEGKKLRSGMLSRYC